MKTIIVTHYFKEIGIIEKYTLKEIIQLIMDSYINNMDYITDDMSLYVEYKDGKYFQICGGNVYGNTKFKKTGIKRVIEDNGSTYSVYGPYKTRIECDEFLYID